MCWTRSPHGRGGRRAMFGRPRLSLSALGGLCVPAAFAAALLFASTDLASAQEWPVDLELVLAVDVSSSVSGEEFDLQVRGLAEAFRSPMVNEAIRASGDLGLAVALIQWSSHRKQVLAVDWTVIHDEKTASDFAEEVENMPRALPGNTAIGSVLEFAIPQFAGNGFQGRRKVIDVSGDGRSNQGPEPWLVRDVVVAHGITVNGLAILNEDPMVDRYYLTNVIGGTGAFVVTANDYEAFRVAIVAKLIKEISGAPLAQRPAPPGIGGPGPKHLTIGTPQGGNLRRARCPLRVDTVEKLALGRRRSN